MNKYYIVMEEIKKPDIAITKMKKYKLKKDLHLKQLNKYDIINDGYIKNIMFIFDIEPNKFKEETLFNMLNHEILYLL